MINAKLVVKDMATAMNLKLDKKGSMCHGFYNGYPFLLEEKKEGKLSVIAIQMCGTNMGQPMTYEMFQNVMFPQGVRMYVGNYRLNLGIDVREDNQIMIQKLTEAISIATSVLKNNGFTGCDELGGVYNINLYSINGSYSYYSIDNVSYLQTRLSQVKEQEKAKKERVPLGILAALGGAIAGAALIILIGKLGYIYFYASVLMVMLIVKPYKKAAGKFSVVSAVITGVLSLISSVVVPRLSSALTIYDAFAEYGYANYISVWDCFVYCRRVYAEAEMMFDYYIDVVLMSVIGIVAAALFIFAELKTVANMDKIQKID